MTDWPALLFGLTSIVVVAFALRAISLDWQSFWLDEVDAIGFAQGDLRALLGMFIQTGENGPLYYLILRVWLVAAGTSEYAVRYLSLLAGVLVIPLSYAVAARLFDRRTGLIAAGLVAGSPFLIWYSQDAKMYALVAALSLASTYLLLRASHENRWTLWIGYVAVTSAGFYLHLYGVFLLVGQIAAYLATLPWHRASLRRWLIAVGCLTLPYLPLAAWQLPTLVEAPPTVHAFVPLPTILRILFNRFSVNHEEWPAWPLIAPFVLAGAGGLMTLLAPRLGSNFQFPRSSSSVSGTGAHPAHHLELGTPDAAPPTQHSALSTQHWRWENRLWLLLWLGIPIVAVFLVSLRLPVFRDRYLTIVAPAYFLLLAVGLARLTRPLRGLPAIGLALALALSATVALTSGPLTRTDFRAAAAYYQTHRLPGDVVGFEATYAARPFLWYAPPDTAAVEFPYTNGGLAPAEADRIVSARTTGWRRVWLVEHEEWLWDGRGLVREALERRRRLVQRVEFSGVRVSLYQ